ncbi:MAG: permease [Brachyspira sp.]|nr:permease [Brachyspira sp.]
MFLKFADWFVYEILGLSESSHFGAAIHFFIYDTIKILFLLFSIISIIALLRSYIDNDKFKNYIEKQPKFIAHLLAAIFGAITPFCSCSSIPLFIGFMEAKISFGIAMSFLITSPMINEIAMLVLAGVVGLKVTVLYVVTGIIVGILGGYIMEKLGYEKYLQDYLKVIAEKSNSGGCCCCNDEKKVLATKERLIDAFDYTKDLMKRIWLFVLLGVGVGAFLHGYVPQEFFMKYMGTGNLFAVPMAVAVGIPLYADVTSIIPIAQVLIDKGAAIGTVLVFMMAVVGLSLPEMIIISRVFKKELIIRFVIFMFITFTIVGYFYNFII